MDVAQLVAQMSETLSTIHSTIANLDTKEHDDRLDQLEQQRDGTIAALRANFERESGDVTAKRERLRREIAEQRRREDEEREARRRKEDEELADEASAEDDDRQRRFASEIQDVEQEMEELMDSIENEAEQVWSSGQAKLAQLEEKRREINRLIDDQLKRPLSSAPVRRRTRTQRTMETAITSKLPEPTMAVVEERSGNNVKAINNADGAVSPREAPEPRDGSGAEESEAYDTPSNVPREEKSRSGALGWFAGKIGLGGKSETAPSDNIEDLQRTTSFTPQESPRDATFSEETPRKQQVSEIPLQDEASPEQARTPPGSPPSHFSIPTVDSPANWEAAAVRSVSSHPEADYADSNVSDDFVTSRGRDSVADNQDVVAGRVESEDEYAADDDSLGDDCSSDFIEHPEHPVGLSPIAEATAEQVQQFHTVPVEEDIQEPDAEVPTETPIDTPLDGDFGDVQEAQMIDHQHDRLPSVVEPMDFSGQPLCMQLPNGSWALDPLPEDYSAAAVLLRMMDHSATRHEAQEQMSPPSDEMRAIDLVDDDSVSTDMSSAPTEHGSAPTQTVTDASAPPQVDADGDDYVPATVRDIPASTRVTHDKKSESVQLASGAWLVDPTEEEYQRAEDGLSKSLQATEDETSEPSQADADDEDHAYAPVRELVAAQVITHVKKPDCVQLANGVWLVDPTEEEYHQAEADMRRAFPVTAAALPSDHVPCAEPGSHDIGHMVANEDVLSESEDDDTSVDAIPTAFAQSPAQEQSDFGASAVSPLSPGLETTHDLTNAEVNENAVPEMPVQEAFEHPTGHPIMAPRLDSPRQVHVHDYPEDTESPTPMREDTPDVGAPRSPQPPHEQDDSLDSYSATPIPVSHLDHHHNQQWPSEEAVATEATERVYGHDASIYQHDEYRAAHHSNQSAGYASSGYESADELRPSASTVEPTLPPSDPTLEQGHDSPTYIQRHLEPESEYFAAGGRSPTTDSQVFVTPMQSASIQSPPQFGEYPNHHFAADIGPHETLRATSEENSTTVHGHDDLFDSDDDDDSMSDFEHHPEPATMEHSAREYGNNANDVKAHTVDVGHESDEEDGEEPRTAVLPTPTLAQPAPMAHSLNLALDTDVMDSPSNHSTPQTTNYHAEDNSDISPISIRETVSAQPRGLMFSRHNPDRPSTPPSQMIEDDFMPRDVTDVPWRARTDSTPMSMRSQSTISSAPDSPIHSSLAIDNHEPVIRDSWPTPAREVRPRGMSQLTEEAFNSFDNKPLPDEAPLTPITADPSVPMHGNSVSTPTQSSLFKKMRSIFENGANEPEHPSPARSRPVSGTFHSVRKSQIMSGPNGVVSLGYDVPGEERKAGYLNEHEDEIDERSALLGSVEG